MGWSAASRLAEKIRERVANVILFELHDPRITLLTVTRVKLTRDKAYCKVYYTVYGSNADRTKTAHALEDACGFIQREVAHMLNTRVTPRLSFVYDQSIEGGLRMHGLLKDLKNEREEAENQKEGGSMPDDSDPDGD